MSLVIRVGQLERDLDTAQKQAEGYRNLLHLEREEKAKLSEQLDKDREETRRCIARAALAEHELAKAERNIEGSPVLSATRAVAEAVDTLAQALRVVQAREDTQMHDEDDGLVAGQNERAPLVETRYGALPVGTRLRGEISRAVYALNPNPRGWRVIEARGDARLGTSNSPAWTLGEIILPLAHDSLGYPLYEGDRVEFRPADDATPAWPIR
jgi:hypothetical protein